MHSCSLKVPIVIQQCVFERMCYTTVCKKYSKQAWNKISIITKRQNVIEKISSDLATLESDVGFSEGGLKWFVAEELRQRHFGKECTFGNVPKSGKRGF